MSPACQARGVSLYGVLSNPDIGGRESAEFVDDFGVEFPVILDSAGDLTLRLGPRVTSESFVISTANRIVYRGRIDDRFAAVGRLRTRNHVARSARYRRGRVSRWSCGAVRDGGGRLLPLRLGRARRAGRRDRRGHLGASRRPVAPGQLRRVPPARSSRTSCPAGA